MKLTISQFPEGEQTLEATWQALCEHVHSSGSQMVLLPELPFSNWLSAQEDCDPKQWRESVLSHERWLKRLPELGNVVVAGTRPIIEENVHYNEAFVWWPEAGYQPAHRKVYLPDEPGFWEAKWYQPGPKEFRVVNSPVGKLGFLICTEVWFGEWARDYGKQGADLLLCPRATAFSSKEKWIAGGRAAAVMSGAYCLSSNRSGLDERGCNWAGAGWLIEPEEGDVLAITQEAAPFITLDIDLTVAERAKKTYPRYVKE